MRIYLALCILFGIAAARPNLRVLEQQANSTAPAQQAPPPPNPTPQAAPAPPPNATAQAAPAPQQNTTQAPPPPPPQNASAQAAPAPQQNVTQQQNTSQAAQTSQQSNTTQSTQQEQQQNQTATNQQAQNQTSNSTVAACKSTFPAEQAPQHLLQSSNFEEQKNSSWLRYATAQLAPCLIQEGQCENSLYNVNKLAGALGTVTQKLLLSQDWQNNSTKFADAVKTDPGLNATVQENAPCVAQQSGGVDSFLANYSQQVKQWAS